MMYTNTQQFLDALKRKMHNAVVVIAHVAEADLKAEVNVSYPPASQPGDPPHRRTGDLEAGIEVDVDGITMIVVSNDPTSSALEWGTSKMAPRPFMRPHKTTMKQRFIPTLLKQLRQTRD